MKCVKPVHLGSKEIRLGPVTKYSGHGKAISYERVSGVPVSTASLLVGMELVVLYFVHLTELKWLVCSSAVSSNLVLLL